MKAIIFSALLLAGSAVCAQQKSLGTEQFSVVCQEAKPAKRIYRSLVNDFFARGGQPQEFYSNKHKQEYMVGTLDGKLYRIEMTATDGGYIASRSLAIEPPRPEKH